MLNGEKPHSFRIPINLLAVIIYTKFYHFRRKKDFHLWELIIAAYSIFDFVAIAVSVVMWQKSGIDKGTTEIAEIPLLVAVTGLISSSICLRFVTTNHPHEVSDHDLVINQSNYIPIIFSIASISGIATAFTICIYDDVLKPIRSVFEIGLIVAIIMIFFLIITLLVKSQPHGDIND